MIAHGGWGEQRVTANGRGLSLGVMKMSTVDCGDGCTTPNTLKTSELYALNVKLRSM